MPPDDTFRGQDFGTHEKFQCRRGCTRRKQGRCGPCRKMRQGDAFLCRGEFPACNDRDRRGSRYARGSSGRRMLNWNSITGAPSRSRIFFEKLTLRSTVFPFFFLNKDDAAPVAPDAAPCTAPPCTILGKIRRTHKRLFLSPCLCVFSFPFPASFSPPLHARFEKRRNGSARRRAGHKLKFEDYV